MTTPEVLTMKPLRSLKMTTKDSKSGTQSTEAGWVFIKEKSTINRKNASKRYQTQLHKSIRIFLRNHSSTIRRKIHRPKLDMAVSLNRSHQT